MMRIASTRQEAIDSNLGAVVGAEEGAIESIPENEGRIAQAWVNVRAPAGGSTCRAKNAQRRMGGEGM